MLKLVWERWKKVPELENVKVSSLGNVKINGKLTRPKVNGHGYFIVEYEKRLYFVHRLVAKAFLKHNLEKYDTIDHIDQNKRNNALSNLEIVPHEENLRRAENNIIRQEFEVSDLPVWGIRIKNEKGMVFKTLQRASNYLMNETGLSREDAVKDILGALFCGIPGKRQWEIVKEKQNGK
jgi:hypothetical protein